jgi:hypothetical protein
MTAWHLQAKPTSEQLLGSKYINKLQVSPLAKTASLFSKKIPISVFRLQFVLSYNWDKHAPLLDYRWAWQQPTWQTYHVAEQWQQKQQHLPCTQSPLLSTKSVG